MNNKKPVISENNFTKLLVIGVTIIGLIIIIVYSWYFFSLEKIDNNSKPATEIEESAMMIHPFDAYSMKKNDLILFFGEGINGEGVDQATKYIDYTQNWFGFEVPARYYYGLEDRVYETILSYEKQQGATLYENMRQELGEPQYDNFANTEEKKKETLWIKDSVNIYLRESKDEKPEVEMHIAYYDNPNNYPMGDRPTIVQRKNVDVTGDGKLDAVLLIGTKKEYTVTNYKNLFVLIGNETGAYYTGFPEERDGGESPEMTMEDLDNDGQLEIIVSADQKYVKNFNVFKFKDNVIENIISSDEEPKNQ